MRRAVHGVVGATLGSPGERVRHLVAVSVLGFAGFAAASVLDSLAGQILCLCLALMGVYGSFPVFWTLPTAFLTGTAAAAGIALINSLGNLAGYVGPQVVAWLTQGSGDFGRALFALGLSMLTPAAVALALRSKRLPIVGRGRTSRGMTAAILSCVGLLRALSFLDAAGAAHRLPSDSVARCLRICSMCSRADGQTIDVLAQPLCEVGFDGVGPAAVDLARGVDSRPQSLVTELVAQARDLRRLHDALGQLRRDEDDAAVAAEDHIAGHDERAADADRNVDADHRGVEPRAGAGVADVMRRIVGANERREVSSLRRPLMSRTAPSYTIPLPLFA